MNNPIDDRHSEALRTWQRWKSGRFRRERDEAVVRLWRLCEPEIWAVAGKLASRLSDTLGRHVTVPEWRHMQGWAEEDVRYKAFPAVGEAAKSYDPCKGAALQTYAYYFIKGNSSHAYERGWIARR